MKTLDIVQVKAPDLWCHECLVIVEERALWGIKGFIPIGDGAQAFVRLEHNEIEELLTATECPVCEDMRG